MDNNDLPFRRHMTRIGVLVNPDAGLGGKLGLKGSDGQAEIARSMGAEDRSGPRMEKMLTYFTSIDRTQNIEWITSDGRMGSDWFPNKFNYKIEFHHQSKGKTSASDTSDAVKILLESNIDILIYGGGDGTTRDIVSNLQKFGQPELPIIGVPSGVKMHSGCFATSPKAAAEVLSSWIRGDLLVSNTEVLDLDEEKYRQGKWIVRLYAEAMTPNSPKWMQGSKELIQTDSEEEIIQGISEHISESLVQEDSMIIWGSGGTLRTIGEILGFNLTTLGIDISIGKSQIASDLNEQQITEYIQNHSGPISLLLSPMGGQGFLIGRGNLQLSPIVITMIGIDNILGIVTPSKLLSVRKLRIDTGDDDLDNQFSELKYMKVIQGFRTTRILPIEVT